MKALYYDELKGYPGIKVGEFPVPEIAGDEVLVRVKAFSLNHLDLWVMSGKYPVTVPLPHIFGSDGSGIIEKTGETVNHIKAGDEVVVFPGLSCGHCAKCLGGRDNECGSFSILGVMTPGTAAGYVKLPARNVFKKPEGLTFEEAAALGITHTTAWNSLVLRAGIRQGDVVLLHGAGSGAGAALIQVAKMYHATIITTVGDDWKIEKAKQLGADFVINHQRQDFVQAVKTITGGGLADIAIDHVGAATLNKSLSCIKKGGHLVTFGATSGDEVTVSLRYLFGKNITVHGVYVGPRSAFLAVLDLSSRHLRPVVDSVFEFRDAQKAYEKMVGRQFFGKIVVRV